MQQAFLLASLGQGVQVLNPAVLEQSANSELTAVVADSRQVQPGCVFVALRGSHTDGHQYLQAAADAGAALLVVQADRVTDALLQPLLNRVAVASTTNSYQQFARIASLLHGEPGKTLTMVGVTGTNGKTTVTHLIERILQEAGQPVGLVGTLGSRSQASEGYQSSGHTTPMADELQRRLASMRDEGLQAVVMEVSSHALDQHRVEGCSFRVAVHTNLTQDHLDYHKTMDRYFAAKARLFAQLDPTASPQRAAIINADDAYAARFRGAVPEGVAIWTYSLNDPSAKVVAQEVNYSIEGACFTVRTPQGEVRLNAKLAGEFSVYNMLAALATGLALGIPLATCQRALEAADGVRGRFEVVARQPYVIVDYAHTPDGLQNVLQAARKVVPAGGRLWVVFGCGGDRDATKRPKMGRIADTLADGVVVTSDNPRSEDPEQIISDILAGIERMTPQQPLVVQPDRRQAIRQALELAQPHDIVVVAGKGHEDYQILADRTIHFDDREEVLAALADQQHRVEA